MAIMVLRGTLPPSEIGKGVVVNYLGAEANKSSRGNDVISLQFDTAPDSASENGWTLEIRSSVGDDTTWYTLDSAYTFAINGNDIDVDLGAYSNPWVWDFHEFRASYDDGTGEVSGLSSFTNDATFTNSSTLDMDGVAATYRMEESSGDAIDSYASNDIPHLNDPGTVSTPLGNGRLFLKSNSEYFRTSGGIAALQGGDRHLLIALRVRFDDVTAGQTIVNKGQSNQEYVLLLNQFGPNIQFNWHDGTALRVFNGHSVTLVNDTWYDIFAGWDNTNDRGFINVNGTEEYYDDSGAAAYPRDSTNERFSMGGNGFATAQLDGRIEDVTISHPTSFHTSAKYDAWRKSEFPHLPDSA